MSKDFHGDLVDVTRSRAGWVVSYHSNITGEPFGRCVLVAHNHAADPVGLFDRHGAAASVLGEILRLARSAPAPGVRVLRRGGVVQ